MKIIYGMVAKGGLRNFDGTDKIISKKVFTRPPTTEEIETFKNACCNSDGMFDLKDDCEITVVEHELVE